MGVLQWTLVLAAAVLQVCLLSEMLRGPYRRFPFLFAWSTVTILVYVLGAAFLVDTGRWTRQTAKVFWATDGLQDVFFFAAMVGLLWITLERGHARRRTLLWLTAAALGYSAVCLGLSHAPRLNLWMTRFQQYLSFGCMLVNLVVWTMLAKRPDPAALLVSAGCGICLAGDAIGHSLRQLSPQFVFTGNMVLSLTHLLTVFVFWRGMRQAGMVRERRPAMGPLEPVA